MKKSKKPDTSLDAYYVSILGDISNVIDMASVMSHLICYIDSCNNDLQEKEVSHAKGKVSTCTDAGGT